MEAINVNGTEYGDTEEAIKAIRKAESLRRKQDKADARNRDLASLAAHAELGKLAARILGTYGRLPDIVRAHEIMATSNGYTQSVSQSSGGGLIRWVYGTPTHQADHVDGSVCAVRVEEAGHDPAWYAVGAYFDQVVLLNVPGALAVALESRIGVPS